MKFAKYLLGITAVTLAALAQAVPLLTEGFDDVAGLGAAGWTLQNVSSPGTDWFQGDNTSAFAAQAGPANSYIASNFLAAGPAGDIFNDLITPLFSLESAVRLTFWARGVTDPGFFDTFRVLVGSSVTGTQIVQGTTVATGAWTEYTVNFAAQGTGAVGQFAFEYFGDGSTSNYIGIDSVSVVTVPEPSTYALLAFGLAGLALIRRRQRAA